MDEVLRYDDPRAVDHPHFGRYATITPGAPGRCPSCEAFGFVDHADVLGHVQTQHCRACRTRWQYRFRSDDTILEVTLLAIPAERPLEVDLRHRAVLDLRREAPVSQAPRAPVAGG